MAVLLSAGARMALLDDDLCLPLRRPDYARGGLNPNPNAQQSARFMANMEQAQGAGTEVDADPFELHLAACVGARHLAATRSKGPICGLNLGRLELLSPAARIVSTRAASYGSSRSGSGLWLYQLERRKPRGFWSDRGGYRRSAKRSSSCREWRRRAVDVAGFTPLTLDNSALLPCSNPVGRGEDSLVGALTRFCHPEGVSLVLPEAIGHVQEAQRRRSDRTLAAHVPHVNYFLRDFVQRQFGLFQADDPARRMGLLADVLRDLAGASQEKRLAHLREYLSYVRADIIDRTQHQIEAANEAPVYWQADAREIVQSNAKALLANAPPRLAEWPEDLDAAGCTSALAEECNMLADACEHWPALWQHAAEQGEKLLSAV